MNTDASWAGLWFWWLLAVLWSFGLIEVYSIAFRRVYYDAAITEWTLSDCIRRWAQAHHWLPAVVVGMMALLAVHWFWAP